MKAGSPTRLCLQLALLASALASIAYGLGRGEGQLVLQRAIRICMECIGLG